MCVNGAGKRVTKGAFDIKLKNANDLEKTIKRVVPLFGSGALLFKGVD